MKRYSLSFSFFETEHEAREFCDKTNKASSRYIKTHKPANYTPWQSDSKTDKIQFVAWYYC